MDTNILIKTLACKMANGQIKMEAALPALKSLSSNDALQITTLELAEQFYETQDIPLIKLRESLTESLKSLCFRYHNSKQLPAEQLSEIEQLPLTYREGWHTDHKDISNLYNALSLMRDILFLESLDKDVSQTLTVLDIHLQQYLQNISPDFIDSLISSNLAEQLNSLDLPEIHPIIEEIASNLEDQVKHKQHILQTTATKNDVSSWTSIHPDLIFDELLRLYENSTDKHEQQQLLDHICAYADSNHIPELCNIINDSKTRLRASLILTLRFGERALKNWSQWLDWFKLQEYAKAKTTKLARHINHESPLLFLLLRNSMTGAIPEATETALRSFAKAESATISLTDFIERRRNMISTDDYRCLTNQEEVKQVIPEQSKEPVPAQEKQQEPTPIIQKPTATEPPKPNEPTVWDKHILPFLTENWILASGILITLVCCSILAYTTWDKHWLWRYTLMPLMLGGFTTGLGFLGSRMEKIGKDLKTMAIMLRSTAIFLLPVNFMTVALLSNDPDVTYKPIIILFMSLLYIIWSGWGLNKWCSEVYKPAGKIQATTLLLINFLVMLGPLARTLSPIKIHLLKGIVGSGFYLGFFMISAVTLYYCHRFMTKKILTSKAIPIFFGTTLAVTYLQVFAWVHGFLRILPQVYTYAPMIICGSVLLFLIEKRFLQLTNKTDSHTGESFLGFAMIILGILMGIPNPNFRILTLLLASAAWLYQAISRKHSLHHWISLTLFTLGIASIGLLPNYPGELYPMLGLAIVIIMILSSKLSTQFELPDLAKSCRGMQHVVLLMTGVTAILCQWHFQSQPLLTAAILLIVAIGFFIRAFRDNQLRWLHVAMIMIAVTLPYLGCVDMVGRTLHGNKMVFGLAIVSIIWLLANTLIKHPLLRQTRSTVLVLYGALAVTGMVLRVVFERNLPNDTWTKLIDYSGPFLITITLLSATWFTRSLIPSGLAFIVVIVLFPELKAGFKQTFDAIGWGSGLGSACSSFAIICSCFYLRKAKFLQKLEGADLFMGKTPFPLRRHDYSLFTWPLMTAALFLILKTESFTFVKNLLADNMHIKACSALFITGLSWFLTAVYFRHFKIAKAATYISWLWLFTGIIFGYYHVVDAPHWTTPFIITLLSMQIVYMITRFYLAKRLTWISGILEVPTRHILCYSAPFLMLTLMILIGLSCNLWKISILSLFIACQLCWHELRTRRYIFSSLLFIFVFQWILALSNPGSGLLIENIKLSLSFTPIMTFFLAIQLTYLIAELKSNTYEKVKTLLSPWVVYSGIATLFVTSAALTLPFFSDYLTAIQVCLLIATLLVVARGQNSLFFLGLAMLTIYCYANFRLTAQSTETIMDRCLLLFAPWRLGLLSLFFCMSGIIGKRVKNSLLIRGQKAMPFFKTTHIAWLYVPALFLATLAVTAQLALPDFRNSSAQLCGSYLAALTVFLVGWAWKAPVFYIISTIYLAIANILLVKIVFSPYLLTAGLSNLHIYCLGLVLTLLEGSIAKRLKPEKEIKSYFNLLSLVIAGMILSLLAINYLISPNLAGISDVRFFISGAMAFLAGRYFRRAARHPEEGETEYADVSEALYHVGITVAIWCFILLIPWFRNPVTALLALGIPALWFYLNTEFFHSIKSQLVIRYRHSTAFLCYLITTIYIFRGILQMTLFPGQPIQLDFYHFNAPFIVVISLILMRLHGLGSQLWHALSGGILLLISSYFSITLFPKTSPFYHPFNGAFCGILLGHFWTLLSYEHSPLRTGIQKLSHISDTLWHSLRVQWGYCLLAGVHALLIWAIINYPLNSFLVAPLLLGTSTLTLHHGIIKRNAIYYGFGALEIMLALHMDFLIPSYLPQTYVIWVLLALWGVATALLLFLDKKRVMTGTGYIAASFFAITMWHILYVHKPDSTVGLWGFAILLLIMALIPRKKRRAQSAAETCAALLFIIAPCWLVFFGTQAITLVNNTFKRGTFGILCTTLTCLLTGIIILTYKQHLHRKYRQLATYPPLLLDQTFMFFNKFGKQVFTCSLYLTFSMTVLIQVLHYNSVFELRELAVMTILYALLTAGWYTEGKLHKQMLPYYLMQLCFIGFFAVIRRQLMLTWNYWNYEYDVWASLAVSFILAGIKQLVDLKPREIRLPILSSIYTLPVIAIIWVLLHRLGSNTAMMVAGLHSMLFVYMGKDDKESPNNVIAIFCFILFIIILFWSKLQLRVIHAYTIPVGTAVLILIQLFKQHIQRDTRNQVRFVTLLVMLGSAGYYTLIHSSYPALYILVFGILSLITMGLGGFLKIRLYLLLGFAALCVDLCASVYHVLIKMDRTGKMALIGSLGLLVGISIIGGALYYKTHQDKISAILDKYRQKLGTWE